jgi:hypothetical protein
MLTHRNNVYQLSYHPLPDTTYLHFRSYSCLFIAIEISEELNMIIWSNTSQFGIMYFTRDKWVLNLYNNSFGLFGG